MYIDTRPSSTLSYISDDFPTMPRKLVIPGENCVCWFINPIK